MNEFSVDLDTVLQGINLVGLGLLGWLIYALKQTVDAQKKTIDAQETHIANITKVLDIVDAPRMAERYEAYKKILDAEKEAYIKDARRQIQEENDQLSHALQETQTRNEINLKAVADLLDVSLRSFNEELLKYFDALKILVVHFKAHPLEWTLTKDSLPPKLRKDIEELLDLLPAPEKIDAVARFKPDIKTDVTRASKEKK